MKRYSLLFVCCLVSLFAAATACAQPGPRGQFGPGGGFTGPGAYPPSGGPGFGPPAPPPPPGGPGFGPSPGGPQGYGYGFNGPAQTVTVAQAKTYGHRTPVILKGSIVQAVGGDLFTFSDSSGEIYLRIGPREWMYFGTIGPQDTIEISGEVCYGNGWEPVHVHARFIRKI